MNKTVTITLGGMVFNFTEEAYSRLKIYLEKVRHSLDREVDHDEVMQDIESSLAEKLNDKKITEKQAVTLSDVEELIKVMGPEEEFGEEKTTTTEATIHKLYRNPDDVIIGGVCSGIAAYFDLDPVIVRLIFIVLFFFGGTGFLLYVILLIILPEAKTTAQKMEMRGEQVTVANIQENLKSNPQEPKKKSALAKIISTPFLVLGACLNFCIKILKAFIPFFRVFLGLFLIGTAIAIFSCAALTCIFSITNYNLNFFIDDYPIQEILNVVPFHFGLFLGFIVLTIPTIILTIIGLSFLRKKKMLSFPIGTGLISVWVITGIVLTSLTFSSIPKVYQKLTSIPDLQNNEIQLPDKNFKSLNVTGKHILVRIVPGTEQKVTFIGRPIDLKNLNHTITNETLDITRIRQKKLNNCINCYEHLVTIKITTPQLDAITAKDNALIHIEQYKQNNNIKLTAQDNAAIETVGDNKFGNLTTTLNNTASIYLNGSADSLTADLKGIAALHTINLKTTTANITQSGSSTTVTIAKSLTAKLSNSARIYYDNTSKNAIILQDNSKSTAFHELNDQELKKKKEQCEQIGTQRNTEQTDEDIGTGFEEQIEQCLNEIIDYNSRNYIFIKSAKQETKDNFEQYYFTNY